MKNKLQGICLIVALAFASSTLFTSAIAQEEIRTFSHKQYEKRYNALITELRCLVCQNQNIADSNADLAKDLRNKTFELIEKGDSDKTIKQYMRDRYGDFVLYSPPVANNTLALWFGPIFVLLIVLIFVIRYIAKQNRITPESE